MRIYIQFDSSRFDTFNPKDFNVEDLISESTDFHIRIRGDGDHLITCFQILQEKEIRFRPNTDEIEYYENKLFERSERLEFLAAAHYDGLTLVLPFAAPNIGEPVSCADGQEYLIESNDKNEYPRSDSTMAVLILTYFRMASVLTISTGLQHESKMTGKSFSVQSIGSLEKPAEQFVKKFFVV